MGEIGVDLKPVTHRVALQGSTVHIGHLDVPLNEAAEYMRGIPAEKWELAFVHAVQVGMAEIMARRRRFQMGGPSAPTAASTPRAEAVTRVAETQTAETQPAAIVEPVSLVETRTAATVEVVSLPEKSVAEEKVIESKVVRPQLEPEGWLRRLDEDFEILDQAQALDPSRNGR